MSATTYPALRGLPPRLIAAELLKLATRRGLTAAVVVLTVGTPIVAYAILELLHVASPAKHGPAGGTNNFVNAIWLVTQLGSIAMILLGATAGAGDIAAGFFRTLVVTGRPRAALFAARVPAGLALVVPLALIDYGIVAGATVLFAGSKPTPTSTELVAGGAWMLLYMVVIYLVAVGLGSFLGSRSTTIAILVALQLVVTPVLQGAHALDAERKCVLGLAIWALAPKVIQQGAPRSGLTMTSAGIATVIGTWVAVALGVGCWRTLRRDA